MSQAFHSQELKELQFKVGVVKERTELDATGYWTDADKIRFRFGRPELMGGWVRAVATSEANKIYGTPRLLKTLRNRLGQDVAFIATNVGLFSSNLSTFYNITPVATSTTHNNTLSTTAWSTKVIAHVSGHGLSNQSLIEIVSAATTIGGSIVINPISSVTATFQVSVVNANTLEFDVGVTAIATSVSTGGHLHINLNYNAGRISDEAQSGWGTGSWGGNFGWGTPFGAVTLPFRQWSADLWGADIMAVPSGGPLMLWSTGSNITDRATIVTAAPSTNQIVRVASEARHVVLYGTHDVSGVYSPLLIRWCSQEDPADWTPTALNTAGDYPLPSRGSEIRAVNRIRDKTAILTDADLYIQSYIGSNDVFGFVAAGEQCGVISQNAAVEYRGILYWMSNNGQFYQHDGRTTSLECSVLRHVYDNLDLLYTKKIYAGVNSSFDEIVWLYTSSEPQYEVVATGLATGSSNTLITDSPIPRGANLLIFLDGIQFPIIIVALGGYLATEAEEFLLTEDGDEIFTPYVFGWEPAELVPPSGTLIEVRIELDSKENNKYVIYNVVEKHWTVGSFTRTVWEDSSTFDNPLALGHDSADLYYHEAGYSADGQPLAAHLEGAFFDSQQGNSIMFANKFTPDFSNLKDNDPYSGNLNISFSSRKYVGGPIITKGPYRVSASTQRLSPRLRGREFAIRIESSTVAPEPWRMGKLRMAIGPDGLR
jgi:hypothetical protein